MVLVAHFNCSLQQASQRLAMLASGRKEKPAIAASLPLGLALVARLRLAYRVSQAKLAETGIRKGLQKKSKNR